MSKSLRFQVDEQVLENGLRILLVERPELPVLSFTLLLPSGVAAEGPEEAGLANFTASLLPHGTHRRDAVRLAVDVDALGASLGVHSDYDYTSVGLSCLSRDQEQAIEILAEVLTQPAFLSEEIERTRHDILSQIERRKDDLAGRVRIRFGELIYGSHPYRSPRLGYAETVAPIDRERIFEFYQRAYRPNHSVLAVVGDLKGGDLLTLLRERFGAWPAARAEDGIFPPIPESKGLAVEKIQKDGVAQATLRIGALALRRNSPDYVAAVLMNYILGGSGFGSRLMKNLREEKGLTYGVYSSLNARKQQGYLSCGLQTGLQTMNQALAEMFRELTRFRDLGVTEEELVWAKRFFTGSLPLSLQTNDQLASHLLEKELYGLEPEFWLKEIEQIRATTVGEVNDVVRRYVQPGNFTVVALADFRAAELRVPAV